MKNLRIGSLALAVGLAWLSSCGSHDRDHEDGGPVVILSSPVTSAVADSPYRYTVVGKDDGGSSDLTYELIVAPAGMTIDSETGKISWLPNYHQVGNNLVTVRVANGDASADQTFAIRVIPDDNGVPFMRGFTLVAWWKDSYLQPQTEASLRQMHEDGVEYVSILVTWYMDTANSTTIYPHPDFTATDEALIHVIEYAHSLGLKVTLKPHIDPLDLQWRGNISFPDEASWLTWFDNYNAFVGHYLDLAEANGVEIFIIGTELKSSENRSADWRNTIALARVKFSGLMTYCANHDSFFFVNWWDALDFIGIDAYFALTSLDDPTVEEIKAAWQPTVPFIRGVAALYDRDVAFMEIGYQSRDGANKFPFKSLSTEIDLQEQADCYQAAMEVFYNEPWFKGMGWWAWSWDPTTIYNDWDVAGKPAESVIRRWYLGHE